MIKAKPTEYKGVLYRSRLEARWAMFLDKNSMIRDFQYEPETFTLPGTSWTYTPDFLINSRRLVGESASLLVEVKPNRPTDEYEKNLVMFSKHMTHPLFIVYGNFYDIPFHSTYITHKVVGLEQMIAAFNKMLFADHEALQSVLDHRFDLKGRKNR